MPAEYVSMTRALDHLRLPADYPADQVAPTLLAAVDFVESYLGAPVYASQAEVDALGDDAPTDYVIARPSLLAGTLIVLDYLFRNRGEGATTAGGTADAALYPVRALSLLYPFRINQGVD